jgi:predicted nucleic acid-binding protein
VLLLDTSAAIPLVVGDHERHEDVRDAVRGARLGLAGHAAFEVYSVLTRLPPPARRTPAVVQEVIGRNFPESRYLGAEESATLARSLSSSGIAGGAVYDALVGAAAREHALPLLTLDHRARDVYAALDVDVRMLD